MNDPINCPDDCSGITELIKIIYINNLELEFYGIIIACTLLTVSAYGLVSNFLSRKSNVQSDSVNKAGLSNTDRDTNTV